MTMATPASKSAARKGESRASRLAREERIFQSLPPLDTPDYVAFVKSARRDDPPASVLARAYRQLAAGDAADATLTRLANRRDPPGYLLYVVAKARRARRRLGSYTPDDLVANTVGEIVTTIRGPVGKIAEGAWGLYLQTCLASAYRALVGRTGFRAGPRMETDVMDRRSQDEGDDDAWAESESARTWRARVEPSDLEWLESFIERTMNKIPYDDVRAIALDLFSEKPSAVSSTTPNDPKTLTGRFGVNRATIYRWQNTARCMLYDALDRQDERDIDLSFLEFRS
ncbi:MAG TPA: hypothetical protein VGM82_09410 [Gemmatimonadaceae bacterium]|jgi:hypothetical protein